MRDESKRERIGESIGERVRRDRKREEIVGREIERRERED